MLDIDLLQSFVAVVESRSFTRAAERVHRTQSTVSQQIRKLEDVFGAELMKRTTAAGQISLTEDGEVLLNYSQRILMLARELEHAIGKRKSAKAIVRLGLPEDFKAESLTNLLVEFSSEHPHIRVDTICGLTAEVEPLLSSGELDLALMKREVQSGPCVESWPEELVWVGKTRDIGSQTSEPLPLALFPQGCLYRERAIHALEMQKRPWRIAYASASLTGILAAVSSGLAVTLLAKSAAPPTLSVLNGRPGFPDVPATEVALVARKDQAQSPAVEYLANFICSSIRKRRTEMSPLANQQGRARKLAALGN
jgi:DNA-binding transcriptional LysR family regulator